MRRFKVLIKQMGKRKEENETKARVIPLWETRNKTAWHQSPPKETHTHTQSHQSSLHSHVHTHVKWLLGRCSDTSDRAHQCEWRQIQHMQAERKRKKKKKHSKGSSWQPVCVLMSSHQATTHTHTYDHQPSCLWQHCKAQHPLCSSSILMHSVAVSTQCHVQKIITLFFFFPKTFHIHGLLNKISSVFHTWLWWWWRWDHRVGAVLAACGESERTSASCWPDEDESHVSSSRHCFLMKSTFDRLRLRHWFTCLGGVRTLPVKHVGRRADVRWAPVIIIHWAGWSESQIKVLFHFSHTDSYESRLTAWLLLQWQHFVQVFCKCDFQKSQRLLFSILLQRLKVELTN